MFRWGLIMKLKSVNNIILIIIDIFIFTVFVDIVYFMNTGNINIFVSAICLLISVVIELLSFSIITGVLYLMMNKILKNTIKVSTCAKMSAVSLLITTLLSFSRIILKSFNLDTFVILSVLISIITSNIIMKIYETEFRDYRGKPVIFVVLMILLFFKAL